MVDRPEKDISSGKLKSTHPFRTIVKSIDFFMESSQLYAATLTHYSTEPLTTGPDYDPLLLLLPLAGDCTRTQDSQGTPAGSASNTSQPKAPATCVQDVRIGYIQDVLDYRNANGWICTACMTLPQPRAPSPPPSPAHTPTMSDKTFNILQWNTNGIGNKQTLLQARPD